MIGFDTETSLITESDLAPPVACLQFADGQQSRIVHWRDGHEAMSQVFARRIPLVGHNIAYDMACVMRTWPDLAPQIFDHYEGNLIEDTGLNHQLRLVAQGRKVFDPGLDDLAKHYLKIDLDKSNPWRLRFGELRDWPLSQWPRPAIEYALADADIPLRIAREIASRPEPLHDRFRRARAAFWLRLAANRGFATDPARVEAFRLRLQNEYNQIAPYLLDAGLLRWERKGGVWVLVRNTKAAGERLLAERPSTPRTASGQVQLAKDVFDGVRDPYLRAYSHFNSLSKKLTTDVPLMQVPVVHTRFSAIQKTGRTGSRDPNIQNLDRRSGARECFVPRPGYTFACADYGKGELCTWSQVCLWLFGRSALANALNRGHDPHLQIAATIVGCSYAEAETRFEAKDTVVDDSRQAGKVANFGFPGGMGIARFVTYALKQYGVHLTEDMARQLKRTWRQTWPEADQYHSWISSMFVGDRARVTVEQMGGSGRWRGGCGYTDACNTQFQGLLADTGLDAGFTIARACYADPRTALYGGHIVNFPHDEFIVEVLDDRAHDAAHELSYLMNAAAMRWCPDVALRASPLLSERFSKSAKAVYQNGRLVPWRESK